MKDENFSDMNEEPDGATPDPMDDGSPYGKGGIDPAVDLSDEELQKASKGSRKFVIAVIVLLLAAAAGVAYYFKDSADRDAWQKKVDDAKGLAQEKKDVAGGLAALRAILQECERKDILMDVVYTVGVMKDKASAPILIKLLDRGDAVSEEAAMALATIGPPEAKAAAEALHAQLANANDVGKARYAWALCAIGDDRGMAPLLEAIGKQLANPKTIHGWDPQIIARMANTDKLIQMADSDNEIIQLYAAKELGFRKDKDVIPALIKLLNSKGRDAVVEAAVALGRSSDERARTALVAKLQGDTGMIDLVLTTVTQSVGSPGLEVIYKGMSDVETKFKIVNRFKELRDPRSAKFLLEVLAEKFPEGNAKEKLDADNIHNQALWTLEELGEPGIAEKMFEKTQWLPATEAQVPDPALRYRQDDMTRRLSNGVPSWFARVKPPGFADYLQKIYDANAPYANTPECAQRVKVDIAPLMDAMGRSGDQRFCATIRPFLDQDEKFHFQAASLALGRLKCDKAIDEFISRMVMTRTERKDELFSTSIETREFSMETRLQERRNSIIATRYLGDPEAAETLMGIALDPMDDPELRTEAAISLAYVADEEVMGTILEKVKDPLAEIGARTLLVEGLAYAPTPAAVDVCFGLLEKETDFALLRAAAFVIGEAADPANDARLNKLLDDPSEDKRRVAAFAVLLGGSTEKIDRVIEIILTGQEARLLMREWYEGRPVLLTRKMFESKAILRRLAVAEALEKKTQGAVGGSEDELDWAWKYLLDRLKSGWDMSPNGLNAREIRELLAEAVRKDDTYRELAANVLSGLAERGYLLALQAEDGPQAAVARAILERLGAKTL